MACSRSSSAWRERGRTSSSDDLELVLDFRRPASAAPACAFFRLVLTAACDAARAVRDLLLAQLRSDTAARSSRSLADLPQLETRACSRRYRRSARGCNRGRRDRSRRAGRWPASGSNRAAEWDRTCDRGSARSRRSGPGRPRTVVSTMSMQLLDQVDVFHLEEHVAIGAHAVETGAGARFGIVGIEFIARDLFLGEAVVGLVVVERLDDVIAIAPGFQR